MAFLNSLLGTAVLMAYFTVPGMAQTSFYKTMNGDSSERLAWSAQVQAGGYVLTGSTNSLGAGNDDIFLMRTADNGAILWQKTFGETGLDRAHYVLETSDQGFLVVGETNSFGLSTTATLLIRTDAAGNVLWSRTYRTPAGGDMNAGLCAVEMPGGDFVFCGYDIVSGNTEALLHCVDAGGNNKWTYIYGGTQPEIFNNLVTSSDGNLVCSGYTYSYGAGQSDIIVLKADTSGQIIWTKVLGDSASNKGSHLLRKQDDSMVLCGTTWNGSSFEEDPFIIHLDQTGNAMWSRTYPATGPQMGYALRSRSSGGYVLSAGNDIPFSPEGYARLIGVSSSGSSLWAYDYFTSDMDAPAVVMPDSAQGWALVRHFSDTAATFSGIGWIRTDSSGNNCTDSIQSLGDSIWNLQTASPNVSTMLVNLINNSVSPQVSTAQFTTATVCSGCNQPVANWGYSFMGSGTYQFSDSSGFAGNWFWTFGDGDSSLISNPFHTYADSGTYQVCLVASNSCGSDTLCQSITWTITTAESIGSAPKYTLSPNPCGGICYLKGSTRKDDVILRDVFGRQLWSSKGRPELCIDLRQYPSGVYYLNITGAHQIAATFKIVRQ